MMSESAPSEAIRAPLEEPRDWCSGRVARLLVPGGVAVLLLCASLWQLTSYLPDPTVQTMDRRLLPPSAGAPFGTDQLGRDVLSRLVAGGLLTVGVATAGVVSAAVLGILTGLLGGHLTGNPLGVFLHLMCQAVLSFPRLWLPLIVLALAGRSMAALLLAILAGAWADFFWVLQREVQRLHTEPFVEAARALGYGPVRIMTVEILPHLLPSAIVLALLHFRGAVILVSTVSFLGLGPPPPTPTWGLMIAEARTFFLDAWWLMAFPVGALAISILAAGGVARALGGQVAREAFRNR